MTSGNVLTDTAIEGSNTYTIKATVNSDIDHYSKREEVREDRAYKLDTEKVKAWKAVGVAYGNNQKSVYYHRTLY